MQLILALLLMVGRAQAAVTGMTAVADIQGFKW